MNLPRVCVLMSTYNGEKFLREQLDSVLNQKSVNLTLFIRDDGSKDKTIEIINIYKENNKNIIFFQGNNVGPASSFVELFYKVMNNYSAFDYYAYADQDDIWLTDKLCRAINFLENTGNNLPKLYCSNQILYINGKETGLRFDSKPSVDVKNIIVKNNIYGCTMVFDNSLALLLNKTKFPDIDILKYRLHDTWTLLVAASSGKVIYDHDSRILYRIHENNCVGIKKNNLWQRIKRRFFVENPAKNLRSKTAKTLMSKCEFECYENQKFVEILANYSSALREKKQLLKYSDEICMSSGENKLLFIIKVLLDII